ncbi:hypothetical protein [Streptomyces vietnamensis]|uniref:hypothetical protein n=1 Tax=Streptomyces vietnamensis TaxID=362257 RepID=UPI000B0FBB43|nr:hypothetical protein [Streptomyces vietnamensis]
MARTTYTTAAGYTVELSDTLFKAYLYCAGCGSGRHISKHGADRVANDHAATCRRTPRR